MGLGAYVAGLGRSCSWSASSSRSWRHGATCIYVLMGIEMILNAANINFVSLQPLQRRRARRPHVRVFVIILAAAEAAVALAIVLNVFHLFDTVRPSEADLKRLRE